MKFSPSALKLAALTERVKNQPIALATGASGALGLAISFGLPIAPDQKIALTSAMVGLANWWSHSQVVPVNKLVNGTVAQSAPGEAVTIASPDGTTTVVGGSA